MKHLTSVLTQNVIFVIVIFTVMAQARMVELVDTLVSGTRARKGVQVQVLFRANRCF